MAYHHDEERMSLELSVYHSGSTSILRVAGSVTEVEVYRFSRVLRNLVNEMHPRIGIDISEIDYMESHALGIMVSNFSAMQNQGRELVLINTNKNPDNYMSHLLGMTHLDRMIKIIQT